MNFEKCIDEITERRLEIAWKLIIEQFFDKSKISSFEHGPGINIFKFLRSDKENGRNCMYEYAMIKDNIIEKNILDLSPFCDKIKKDYDYTKHLLICVHVPLGYYGDETVGNIKLFSIETKKEITFDDNEEKKKVESISELRRRKTNT